MHKYLLKIKTATPAIMLIVSVHAQAKEAAPADTVSKAKELREVVVSGMDGSTKRRISMATVSGAEINRLPTLLGERDVIKSLQVTPGVVSGTEGFAGLYVRGGETDQNLYLADGLPLLNVYHLGGLFSAFNTHSVDRVDFYKGIFPAQYSGRVSSVVDISLKNPDYTTTGGVASLGLISGQLYLSTPIRRGSSALAVSLRRTWLDALSTPALAILNATKKADGKKTIFGYNFTDIMVKLRASDSHGGELSTLVFAGKDNFKLGEERFGTDDSKNVYESDQNKLSWGNWGAVLTYTRPISRCLLSIQPYISKAFSSDIQSNMRDKSGLSVTTEMRPSVLQTGMRESARLRVTRALETEVGMEQAWHDNNVGSPKEIYGGASGPDISPSRNAHCTDATLSAYCSLDLDITGMLHASAGLRVNRYMAHDVSHWGLEPRLSLRVPLSENSSILAGYSRTAQYAQQVSSSYIYLPSDAWLPTAVCHEPLTCDFYTLGYSGDLGRSLSLKAEAWMKRMAGLAEYRPGSPTISTTESWRDKITFGRGWAHGMDIELFGVWGPVSWNAAYGLMWNWRKFPDLNSGHRFPAKFDNRHKIDIGASWEINSRLELSAQWEYMTGNRATVALYNIAPPDAVFPESPFVSPIDPGGERQDGIDYYQERNNVRMPPFHRLNLNLSLRGRLKGKLEYQWDFGLYNAYCRMNPFAMRKSYVDLDRDAEDGSYRRFKTISLIPILPSVSYTLKF